MTLPSGTESNAPPPRKRRLFRALAICGGACLLVVLLLLALQSGPARELVLDRVTAFLASQRIELQTESLRYNMFSLSLDARNLRLRSAASPDLPAFATIGRVQLDLSLTALLRGRYVVRSGVVDDVDVQYVVAADGRDNLPLPPADPHTPRKPVDYLIANLSIPKARVRYANHAQQVDLVLPLASIQMTGDAMTARHRVRFEGSKGEVRMGNHVDVVDHLSGVLDLGDEDVRVDRLHLGGAGSRIAVGGTIRNFDAPQLGLTLQATVDAARTAALLDVRDPVTGTVAVNATVRGPLAAPAIEGHLSGSGLRFRSLGAAQVHLKAAYDMRARGARVSSARIEAPWGRLSASGELALDRERSSRVNAELGGVDLAALMQGLNLPYIAATRVDGKIDAQWPGLDYSGAAGAATATLTPTSSRVVPRTIPLGGRVTARSKEGMLVADVQQITAGGAKLTGRVQLDRERRLDGRLRMDATDLGATARTAEVFLGRAPGSLLPGPVTGAATIAARLGGTLDTPTASATVSAPSLSMGTANGIDIAADVNVTPAAVTLARADANWNGAHAGLRGTVELTGRQRLDLALDADAADVQPLLRTAQPDAPVSGALSARGTVSGTLRRPVASLALQGADIAAFGERFGSLTADAAVAGSDITLSRLVVDKPQPEAPGRIIASGSYNLDRKRYTLDLQSENVRLLALSLPGGQRVRGTVQLSAKGAGAVSSPSGTLNLVLDSLEIDGLQRNVTDSKTSAAPPARVGRIAIAANAADHQATITASAEHFNLDAHAVVALARPWPTQLTVRANDLDLERLPVPLRGPLDGRLRATLNATGDSADPARGRAAASIDTLAGTWNGQPFSVTSPGEVRYADQRLAIERLELTARDSSLVVKGELPLTADAGAGDLGFEARANLATLTRLLPPDMKVTGDGAMTLTGSVRGTLTSIVPDLLLTVENGMLSAPQLGPGASALQLTRACDRRGGRDRSADGPVGRRDSRGVRHGPARGASTVARRDPSPGRSRHDQGLGPRSRSRSHPGCASRPGRSCCRGRRRIGLSRGSHRARRADRVSATRDHVQPARRSPSRNRRGSASAPAAPPSNAWRSRDSAGSVTASGTVGLAGERPLDVKVDGSLKVAALSVLSKTIRTDGTATWKVAAHGSLTTPQLNGSLDLADVMFASDDLDIAATHVNAHVNLAGTRIELTSSMARSTVGLSEARAV